MESLHHNPTTGNPCPESCPICDDADATELAAHLGLADEPDPAIEADARAADSIRWGLWSPDLPRTYHDEDSPGERGEAFELPGDDDRSWAAQFSEEGCAEDDLSPWEEALEVLTEPAWERACRLAAQIDEEEAEIAGYYRTLELLGGFPESW